MLEITVEQRQALECFCRKWHVIELAFFGSAMRTDFDELSDVDVLLDFAPAHTPGFAFMNLCRELALILGRRVDVLTRAGIERANDTTIKDTILRTAREYHASQHASLS